MQKRRIKSKDLKKQRNMIILGLVFLMCVFSVGYGAFQTNIALSVTGKIKSESPYALLKKDLVTTGDGLYDNGDGTYSFRGANPNNYIEFNNEVWRIMSIDSNKNIKIIRDERIDLSDYTYKNENNVNGQFDPAGNRTMGYCSKGSAPTYGCNVWASTTNMGVGEFANGSYSGAVEADAPLNTYLNGTYKAKLQATDDWKYVKTGMTWNVGPAGYGYGSTTDGVTTYTGDSNSVSQLQSLEGAFHWTGDIALATESEYIRANSNSSCLTNSALAANANTNNCRTTNYLYKSGYWYWLLSPRSGNTNIVLDANPIGNVSHTYANHTNGSVRPVLYLKSNIKLTGSGGPSSDTIYKITE